MAQTNKDARMMKRSCLLVCIAAVLFIYNSSSPTVFISPSTASHIKSRVQLAATMSQGAQPEEDEWWADKYPIPAPMAHPGVPIPFQYQEKKPNKTPSQYIAGPPRGTPAKPIENGESLVMMMVGGSAFLIFLGLVGQILNGDVGDVGAE